MHEDPQGNEFGLVQDGLVNRLRGRHHPLQQQMLQTALLQMAHRGQSLDYLKGWQRFLYFINFIN